MFAGEEANIELLFVFVFVFKKNAYINFDDYFCATLVPAPT